MIDFDVDLLALRENKDGAPSYRHWKSFRTVAVPRIGDEIYTDVGCFVVVKIRFDAFYDHSASINVFADPVTHPFNERKSK